MKTQHRHAPLVRLLAAAFLLASPALTASPAQAKDRSSSAAAIKARADAIRQREYERNIAAAQSKAAAADVEHQQSRQVLAEAESKANRVAMDLRTTFEASVEHRSALSASNIADEKRTAVEKELLSTMQNNAVYVAAVKAQQDAAAKVARLHADPAVTPDLIAAASIEAAHAGSAPGEILDEAAKNSPTVSKARAEALEANKRLSQLNAEFKRRFKSDPALVSSNQASADARTACDKASLNAKQAHAALSAILRERDASQ